MGDESQFRNRKFPVAELQTVGHTESPGATAVLVGGKNAAGEVTSAAGTTVPGSEAGYAKGCMFIKTNTANGTHAVYWNIGDATTANFVVNDAVLAGDLSLANGKIFGGNGSGLAAAYTLAVAFAGTAHQLAGTNSAPALTMGGAAISPTLNGFTGTTSGNVTTISSGGASVNAHALAGAVVTDGTIETTILDNSALTASTGTITTVLPLAGTITATGKAYQLVGTVAAPAFTGETYTPAGTCTPSLT